MYKHFFKRLFDIVISLIALIFFIPIFIVFAPIVYFTDRGPIFYNAYRFGKNGKKFKMFKFRSMYVNAPDIRLEDGSTFSGEKDCRVTPIGRFLRKTSLDELPQFINVFLGQMSLIGPRPNLISNYDELSEIEKQRLKVKPGLTGFNQAYFRNSVSTQEKYEHDIYYIEHLSFILDLKIFLKTISSVIKRKNINSDSNKKTSERDKVS